MARLTNEQVINAFMDQRPANGGALTTDGQSLFSYNLRIAEYVPNRGGLAILVYDYTSRGKAFKSQSTSNHVGMIKQRVPKSNWVFVEQARSVGLVS